MREDQDDVPEMGKLVYGAEVGVPLDVSSMQHAEELTVTPVTRTRCWLVKRHLLLCACKGGLMSHLRSPRSALRMHPPRAT